MIVSTTYGPADVYRLDGEDFCFALGGGSLKAHWTFAPDGSERAEFMPEEGLEPTPFGL
jgi:hypothetical protein